MTDRIFLVEITNGQGLYTEVKLPATDYEILDALDRVNLSVEDDPNCTIYRYAEYGLLGSVTDANKKLFQTNALARKLSEFNEVEAVCFEGLVRMDIERNEGAVALTRLIDLAYSTDCCNTAPACNDYQLGKFYADNGFISELDDLPDSIYEMLDFAKIGRDAREAEHGVLTPNGYVVQTAELEHLSDSVDFEPHKPDYVFRLMLRNADKSLAGKINLPAEQNVLVQTFSSLGYQSLEGVSLELDDGVSLNLDFNLESSESLADLNNLAKTIVELDSEKKLPVLKALLYAESDHTVVQALKYAMTIDDYILEPTQRSASDLARDELRFTFDDATFRSLLPHVDLLGYGQELLRIYNSEITPYGVIQHKDGIPLHSPERQANQDSSEILMQ